MPPVAASVPAISSRTISGTSSRKSWGIYPRIPSGIATRFYLEKKTPLRISSKILPKILQAFLCSFYRKDSYWNIIINCFESISSRIAAVILPNFLSETRFSLEFLHVLIQIEAGAKKWWLPHFSVCVSHQLSEQLSRKHKLSWWNSWKNERRDPWRTGLITDTLWPISRFCIVQVFRICIFYFWLDLISPYRSDSIFRSMMSKSRLLSNLHEPDFFHHRTLRFWIYVS